MTHTNSKNWLKHLNSVIYSLNHSYNSSVGMAPANVTIKDESEIWDKMYNKIIDMNPPSSKLKIGDVVRIGKTKIDLGRKSYLANWTDELFKISNINHDSRPVLLYSLTDLTNETDKRTEGTFTEHQLNKVSGLNNNDK